MDQAIKAFTFIIGDTKSDEHKHKVAIHADSELGTMQLQAEDCNAMDVANMLSNVVATCAKSITRNGVPFPVAKMLLSAAFEAGMDTLNQLN